jgi:hypothetical protein
LRERKEIKEMNNNEVKRQLSSIIKALSTIAVRGDDVLTLAQVFQGLEYTIENLKDEDVSKEE